MSIELSEEPKPMTEPQKAHLLSLLRGIPELKELHTAMRLHFRWEDEQAGVETVVDTESGPEVTEAKPVAAQKVKVVMCVPFPGGRAKCSQCESSEITHTVVYEMEERGEKGTAFGCVCATCAEGIETKLEEPEGN